jgi:hypothetical protein
MKIFVAYRYTGEDISKLEKILSKIKNILEKKGNDIFCSLFFNEHFESKKMSTNDVYKFCLEQLISHDLILFFIKSEEKSHGMELELRKAIEHKKKIVVAIQKNLCFSEYRIRASKIIEFDDLPNLFNLLKTIDL